jgi:integrase
MSMHGSIRQRSIGSFELRVFTGTDPATGRRCYRSKTVRGNRAEAERELATMVEIVGRGPGIAARTTVVDLLEQWFTVASANWSPTTVRQTRSVLNRQLHPYLDAVFVADLTTAGIDSLYSHLLARGGAEERPLKPGTVKRVHVVLSSALSQAMRWGWIWDNPAERAHRITVVPTEPDPPSPDELHILLNHLRDREPAFYLFVMLGAMTGARRAQLLGLRWRNIDLQVGQIAFTNGYVEGPTGPVLAATKNKRSHTVELDESTINELRRHRDAVGRDRELDRNRFVFVDPDGDTWKPNRVTKAFQRHLVAAGLRPFRLHDLRHFMATQMLLDRVPIPIVSRRLAHRRVSTTLDFYAHVTPAGDLFAADALHNVIAMRPMRSKGGAVRRAGVPSPLPGYNTRRPRRTAVSRAGSIPAG